MPGVVTHSTDLIEHPELVSERIQRFARLVGAENVVAGCDCGFGGRTHPQIVSGCASRAVRRGSARQSPVCDGSGYRDDRIGHPGFLRRAEEESRLGVLASTVRFSHLGDPG